MRNLRSSLQGARTRRMVNRVVTATAIGAVAVLGFWTGNQPGAYGMTAPQAAEVAPAAPGAVEAAPNAPPKKRRTAREIALDIDAHLKRHDAALKPGRSAAVPAADPRVSRAELRRAAAAALDDLRDQTAGGASLLYWAASMARDAADAGDDHTLERARRYLDHALRTAGDK